MIQFLRLLKSQMRQKDFDVMDFKIDDEIITYTGKTDSTFTGCIRGFSGVSSLKNRTLRRSSF